MPRDTIVDWSLFCCILKCIYLHKSFFSCSLVSRAVCFPDRKSGVVAAYFHLPNTLKYCQISNSNKKNSAFQTENLVLSRRVYISLILLKYCQFSNSNNKKNSAFQTENLVLSRRIYISLILWNIVNFQIRTTRKSLKKTDYNISVNRARRCIPQRWHLTGYREGTRSMSVPH